MSAEFIEGLPGPEQLHQALDELLGLAAGHPEVVAEMQRARREFFGPTDATVDEEPERAAVAEWRFAEWFLLERESDVLGVAPARRWLAQAHRASNASRVEVASACRDALLGSLVGVFIVESKIETQLRLRDLQDGKLLDVTPPVRLGAVPGDLLVGRLYGSDDDDYTVSFAVALQPDGRAVATAFERDLAQTPIEHRLSQAELEQLLFRQRALGGAPMLEPLERIEAALDAYFVGIGWSGEDVADISTTLRAVEDPQTVIGPLMDRVAFDTEGDLEQLRRLLVALSQHRPTPSGAAGADPATLPPTAAGPQSSETPAKPAPGQRPDETLGQFLARRIESGLEAHENIDDLFRDVAELMGEPRTAFDEDPPEADAATAIGDAAKERLEASFNAEDGPTGENGSPADPEEGLAQTAAPGDLDALVEEYLWETERGGSDAEIALRDFEEQQRELPVPRLIVEDIPVDDLLRYLLQVYLQSPPAQRSDAVVTAHRELGAFYGWLDETQEFDVAKIHAATGPAFVEHVPRCAGASEALSEGVTQPEPGARRPVLTRVVAIDAEDPPALELLPLGPGEPGAPGVAGERGANGTVFATIPATAVPNLEVEDLVLGGLQLEDGVEPRLTGMVIVLPAASDQLLG